MVRITGGDYMFLLVVKTIMQQRNLGIRSDLSMKVITFKTNVRCT